jgi:hypothetical protein
VDDELCENGVECTVLERKRLRRRAVNRDAGEPCACRCNERLRGIRGDNAIRTKAGDELGGQRPGATAHVEDGAGRTSEVGEARGETPGVATHQAVVRIGCDVEHHHSTP